MSFKEKDDYFNNLDAMSMPWVESPFFDTLIENVELTKHEKNLAKKYNKSGYVVIDLDISDDEIGIKERKIADQISNLPFSSHHTKVITFTDKQLNCLINAMAEYQNDVISYGLSWPIDFGLVNEDGSFAGILADIDAKIEEVM